MDIQHNIELACLHVLTAFLSKTSYLLWHMNRTVLALHHHLPLQRLPIAFREGLLGSFLRPRNNTGRLAPFSAAALPDVSSRAPSSRNCHTGSPLTNFSCVDAPPQLLVYDLITSTLNGVKGIAVSKNANFLIFWYVTSPSWIRNEKAINYRILNAI